MVVESKKQKEKPYLGVDYMGKRPYAFCGDQKWNLKPNCAGQATIDVLIKVMEEHTKATEKLPLTLQYKAQKESYLAARKILETVCEDFDWDTVANNGESGPGLLVALSIEARDFFMAGGTHALRRALTAVKLAEQS